MDDKKSVLESVPKEIRNSIYEFVLLDPVKPILEGENKSTKYKNYLNLLYVNKQFEKEVKAVLELIKPVFIISCNIPGLGDEMMQHGIPILSDHHLTTVKYHALRLHVRFPLARRSDRTLKSYVVLREHLFETCLLLRGRSLDPATYVNESRIIMRRLMRITVGMDIDEDKGLSESEQIKIVKQMKLLKYAGGVTVKGCTTDAVLKVIEPYEQLGLKMSRENGQMPDFHELFEHSKARVLEDSEDSIKFLTWRNATAAKAYRAKDYQRASSLHEKTLKFIAKAPTKYHHFVHPEDDHIFPKLDDCSLEAELGFLECCVELGKERIAVANYMTLANFIADRPIRPQQSIVDRAVKLEMRLRSEFGDIVAPSKLCPST